MLHKAIERAGDSQPVTDSYKTVPLGRHGEADEVANLIAFLLSDESSYITGVVHPIDGGLLA